MSNMELMRITDSCEELQSAEQAFRDYLHIMKDKDIETAIRIIKYGRPRYFTQREADQLAARLRAECGRI